MAFSLICSNVRFEVGPCFDCNSEPDSQLVYLREPLLDDAIVRRVNQPDISLRTYLLQKAGWTATIVVGGTDVLMLTSDGSVINTTLADCGSFYDEVGGDSPLCTTETVDSNVIVVADATANCNVPISVVSMQNPRVTGSADNVTFCDDIPTPLDQSEPQNAPFTYQPYAESDFEFQVESNAPCAAIKASAMGGLENVQFFDCSGEQTSEQMATCKKAVQKFAFSFEACEKETMVSLVVQAVIGGPCFQCPADVTLQAIDVDEALAAQKVTDRLALQEAGVQNGCLQPLDPFDKSSVTIDCKDETLCAQCCRGEVAVERTWTVTDVQCQKTTSCTQIVKVLNPGWQMYFPAGSACKDC